MQLFGKKKKTYPVQRRLIAEQQNKAKKWSSKDITDLTHINCKKNHYIWCAHSNEVTVALCQVLRLLLPNTTDHDSDQMQDLSWQLPCCLQQLIRNISIFTWTTATRRSDVSEQQPNE